MQERYLGDVHDFLKYRFLRHIKNSTNFAIGLNWYLTQPKDVDPKNTNDGEKRFHLKGLNSKQWLKWDSELFNNLKFFNHHSERKLNKYYKLNILDKGTVYYDAQVPTCPIKRMEWHKKAMTQFKNSNLIFLDPDNGFEVPSARGKRTAKYVEYDEIAEYCATNKAVVSIQFARQCDPVKKARDIRAKLQSKLSKIKSARVLPIIRCRVPPNILFVPIAPSDGKEQKLEKAIESFQKSSPLMTTMEKRIELIK